jgi:hypothetical protein
MPRSSISFLTAVGCNDDLRVARGMKHSFATTDLHCPEIIFVFTHAQRVGVAIFGYLHISAHRGRRFKLIVDAISA